MRGVAGRARRRARRPLPVTTYGRPGSGADWIFEVAARSSGGRAVLDIARRGERVLSLETSLPGIYNKENLVGAVAPRRSLGVDLQAIARASRRFQGVKRRQEVRGIAAGVTVVDDFAHHPTAIRETVLALKGRYGPGKLIAAFEPRSATSRRAVFQHEFADALSVADEVVLAPLYAPEKVPEAERLDVERLAADLRREDIPARLIATVDETAAHLAERAAPGDTVLIMSSGDYGGLHDKVLFRLGDPVMPSRIEHKQKISALLNRVGIAHPVLDQFWPSYLVIPGAAPSDPLVGCVAVEAADDVALLRMLGGRAGAAGRGARLLAGRDRDRTRALAGRAHAVPGHRRRAGLLRREARVRGQRSQGRRAGDRGNRGVFAGAVEDRHLDEEGAVSP